MRSLGTSTHPDQRPVLRLVHSLPGRARLRLDASHDRASILDAIERELGSTPGVREVRTNPLTGSILVVYDSDKAQPLQSHELYREASEPAPPAALGPAPSSRAAANLMRSFWRADVRLSEWSGSRIDLKLAIPCAFLAAGVWELVAGAELAAASFHTLAWYSYNVFVHLHPHEFHHSTPVGSSTPASIP